MIPDIDRSLGTGTIEKVTENAIEIRLPSLRFGAIGRFQACSAVYGDPIWPKSKDFTCVCELGPCFRVGARIRDYRIVGGADKSPSDDLPSTRDIPNTSPLFFQEAVLDTLLTGGS